MGETVTLGTMAQRATATVLRRVWLERMNHPFQWVKPTFRHDNRRYLHELEIWPVVWIPDSVKGVTSKDG